MAKLKPNQFIKSSLMPLSEAIEMSEIAEYYFAVLDNIIIHIYEQDDKGNTRNDKTMSGTEFCSTYFNMYVNRKPNFFGSIEHSNRSERPIDNHSFLSSVLNELTDRINQNHIYYTAHGIKQKLDFPKHYVVVDSKTVGMLGLRRTEAAYSRRYNTIFINTLVGRSSLLHLLRHELNHFISATKGDEALSTPNDNLDTYYSLSQEIPKRYSDKVAWENREEEIQAETLTLLVKWKESLIDILSSDEIYHKFEKAIFDPIELTSLCMKEIAPKVVNRIGIKDFPDIKTVNLVITQYIKENGRMFLTLAREQRKNKPKEKLSLDDITKGLIWFK